MPSNAVVVKLCNTVLMFVCMLQQTHELVPQGACKVTSTFIGTICQCFTAHEWGSNITLVALQATSACYLQATSEYYLQ